MKIKSPAALINVVLIFSANYLLCSYCQCGQAKGEGFNCSTFIKQKQKLLFEMKNKLQKKHVSVKHKTKK